MFTKLDYNIPLNSSVSHLFCGKAQMHKHDKHDKNNNIYSINQGHRVAFIDKSVVTAKRKFAKHKFPAMINDVRVEHELGYYCQHQKMMKNPNLGQTLKHI